MAGRVPGPATACAVAVACVVAVVVVVVRADAVGRACAYIAATAARVAIGVSDAVIAGVVGGAVGFPVVAVDVGDVAIDAEIGSRLKGRDYFGTIKEAHELEHSLEVQVPFIRHVRPEARILPITVSAHRLDDLLAAGEEIAALFTAGADLMMVASSDMSHYITAARARELDFMAIERMLQLDAEGLYRVVRDQRISMCGVAPTVIMLHAARRAGAGRAELVCYTHSGEVSGDTDEVVGYASLVVY